MLEHITVSYGIPLAYIALGIGVLGMIAFPIIQMAKDLKKAITTFVAIGILAVVFFICYFLSANEPFTIGDIHIAGGQMKFVEAGIYLTYILLTGAVIAILYSSVSRYFK